MSSTARPGVGQGCQSICSRIARDASRAETQAEAARGHANAGSGPGALPARCGRSQSGGPAVKAVQQQVAVAQQLHQCRPRRPSPANSDHQRWKPGSQGPGLPRKGVSKLRPLLDDFTPPHHGCCSSYHVTRRRASGCCPSCERPARLGVVPGVREGSSVGAQT
jgi:hypothetical protein